MMKISIEATGDNIIERILFESVILPSIEKVIEDYSAEFVLVDCEED